MIQHMYMFTFSVMSRPALSTPDAFRLYTHYASPGISYNRSLLGAVSDYRRHEPSQLIPASFYAPGFVPSAASFTPERGYHSVSVDTSSITVGSMLRPR
ncbi:hypothetical protein J6590_087714 [Homalodisca vitripennis]|nr:hypothetical protein J6590_087714 [Homalodisca vitripennis]